MSLRARLVALVLGLTTLLLGGLGLYLGGSFQGWSSEVLDRELYHRAEIIAQEVKLEDGALELEEDEAETLSAQGWPWRIETLEGTVLAASRTWPVLQPGQGAGEGFETLEARGGRTLRVRTITFEPHHGDGQRLRLRVAAPTSTFAPFLQRLRVGLLVALGLSLLLGALGTAAIAQVFLAPLRRLSGQVAQVEASSLDTRLQTADLDPDLRRLAEAFNGVLGRLGLAFEGQRAFVARASHALRTPLSSILTQAEVALRRERTPPEYRATLEEIAEAARHSATLAQGLLALSRADAAAGAAQRERLPVATLADELARLFRPRVEEAGLTLEVSADPGLAVVADRARLRELLDALLDNAVRYTPRGGKVVFQGRARGAEAVLEVRDSGPGFAAGEEGQVLEPFFRGRAAANGGPPGSGLGLSVARALAVAEGGRLELGAAAEGGARVALTLPRAS